MVHGKNRIPYRIDRRLTGLAGPEYDATISFGLPIEPEDSRYGESWLRGDRPDEVAAISTMVFPLVAFAVGLVILYYMFGIGWLGWYGGPESVSGGDSWLLLAVLLALCAYSIIWWGLRSESYCDRKRWAALILASVLFILFGAWWIYSLGLFIAVTGLALLIYSSARLAATYRCAAGDGAHKNSP